MKNKEQVFHVLAEQVTISESSSNEIFLVVDFKMFDNSGNLNREGVTKAFINDMMANVDYYTALPLYCDDENLLGGNFRRLGHKYDERNGTFGTQQIGGFVNFRTVEEDGLVSVYGTARIPKREAEICKRIIELYELGKLSISFEVKFNPKDTFIKDGVRFIDVGEQNKLTGACVVWTPAFPDAQAQQLIAEANTESDVAVGENAEARTEVKQMPNNEEVSSEIIAEEENNEVVEAEVETAENDCRGENEEEKNDVETASEDKSGENEEENEDVETAKKRCCGEDGKEMKDDEVAPQDEKQEAQAQVLEESVTVTERVEQWCPDEPPVHIVETHERFVETIEEKDRVIADLQNRIAELETVEQKYNEIIAEQEKAAMAEKRAKAKAFAQKQGLNVEDVAVAEAIESLNYEMIAQLSMENNETQDVAVAEKETVITLASFVDLETKEDGKFGGMLKRRSN